MKIRLFVVSSACVFAAWLGLTFMHSASVSSYLGKPSQDIVEEESLSTEADIALLSAND